MTDLLLITDVPRLRKIFSRLSDNRNIRLRIANSLEKGGEELVAEKPGIVFVQTHLSGLSAEIILMHLKKQLGRKRTRFVLLSNPAQDGSESARLYHGHIDTTLDDESLLTAIKDTIATLLTKVAKKVESETIVEEALPAEPEPLQTVTPPAHVPAVAPSPAAVDMPSTLSSEEPSLVDQGVTYAPRQRLSVYSEFNSSFDSAVSNMQPAAALDEAIPEQKHDWDNHEIETIEPASSRSKRATFLLWLAPVVIAVIAVTVLQQKRTAPAPSGPVPQVLAPAKPAPGTERVPAIQQQQQLATAVVPLQSQKPTNVTSPVILEAQLSDKAVLSAIAENRGNKDQARTPAKSGRLTVLPDFIPRAGVDKAFANANPGWERYKGLVTEFKVFREGTSIKAIQVIDRGGNGVPESFMKAVLRQVSKNPAYAMDSTEKKEGYEIQRGHTADNLKVMYYRDDHGGNLRAFVLTWQ